MVAVDKVYHIILPHGDSLAAVEVVFRDAQGDGAVVVDGEAPGTTLRLVTRLVVYLSGDGVHPFRQAHGGGVGEAARCVDLRGDHLAVDDERSAERLDAQTGLWIGQGGGDERPRGGDDRAVGRDGVADEGRLVVKLQAEEGRPGGPVVDVICGLDAQIADMRMKSSSAHPFSICCLSPKRLYNLRLHLFCGLYFRL
jgi:hypothetical protein